MKKNPPCRFRFDNVDHYNNDQRSVPASPLKCCCQTNDDEIENLLERKIKLLFVCYLLGEEIRTIKMYVDI